MVDSLAHKETRFFFIKALIVLFISQNICALSRSDREFINRYRVDSDIERILDVHADELNKKLNRIAAGKFKQHEIWTFKWLPGYYVKYDISRIHSMQRVKDCMEQHNLDLLDVPDKRLYHVKGRSDKLTSLNYVVVVKGIVADPHFGPLTLKHVEQLTTLMKECGYIDMTRENYIRSFHNKVVIIDTESYFEKHKILNRGFMRMISGRHNLNTDYTPDALKYILAQMALMLARWHGSDHQEIHRKIIMHFSKTKSASDYLEFFERHYAQAKR